MGRDDLKGVAASVRQRLLNRARERGEEYQLLLERYVQERFLYRLEQSRYGGEFVLKGATLFIVWQGERHRVTRDLDLLGKGTPTAERLEERIAVACHTDVEDDGVRFLRDTVEVGPIREDQEYEGLRARVEARIGSARIRLQIDVGFGDAVWPEPRPEVFPVLLDDFEAPRPRVYPKEPVVAEKFQAMVDLGMANSRMKDFYDVWVLSNRFAFDGATLAEAMRRTFERRRTSLPTAPPLALTKEFAGDAMKERQWIAFTRKGRLQVSNLTLDEVITRIRPFLMEPVQALTEDKNFDLEWPQRGPWQPPGRE